MTLESVELFRVAMPLVYPFRTAFGDEDCIESLLVRLTSAGTYGWGEAAPWRSPAYSSECAATAFIVARDFIAPLLIGQDIPSGQALQQHLAGIKGNQFAKAAFDLAWWDLHAKQAGEPLWKVLGGEAPVVDAGADFGVMESIDALLEAIGGAVEQGYKRVKLKYRPGWELDMIGAVREAFGDTAIHVDCNSAYNLHDLDMFQRLDHYGLTMIEQPLSHDDLVDHAKLQAYLRTPICLDESITSADRARKALEIKACRWVNIKPGRVGGLTNALAVHDVCQDMRVPCWVGGMLESAIGASHCLALATLPNIRYPSDIFPSERFYAKDLATPPMTHSAPSQFTAADTPGIGVEPDPDMLEQCTLDHAFLER